MSRLVTPRDVAKILRRADLPYSQGRKLFADIWLNEPVGAEYTGNERLFARHVDLEMVRPRTRSDALELMLATDGALTIKHNAAAQQIEPLTEFFRGTRLELLYVPGRNYRRIKLRTLLGMLGYQRRSPQLVANIKAVLRQNNLRTHSRGDNPCDIGQVSLDSMVVIRLRRPPRRVPGSRVSRIRTSILDRPQFLVARRNDRWGRFFSGNQEYSNRRTS